MDGPFSARDVLSSEHILQSSFYLVRKETVHRLQPQGVSSSEDLASASCNLMLCLNINNAQISKCDAV